MKFLFICAFFVLSSSMSFASSALKFEVPKLQPHADACPANGEHKIYYTSGELHTVTPYINCKIQGDELRYHQNGKIEWKIPYINGQRHGNSQHFDQNGQLIRVVHWEYGRLISSQSYQNGIPSGKLESYDKLGNLIDTH